VRLGAFLGLFPWAVGRRRNDRDLLDDEGRGREGSGLKDSLDLGAVEISAFEQRVRKRIERGAVRIRRSLALA
jgi:hypothetical protein